MSLQKCFFFQIYIHILCLYIHTHISLFLCSNGDKSHTTLCESQVHSAPEPTHQQVCRAESLSGVRSYSALQHKPFPFYFPKAGAFEQAHFRSHPWFNLPGRNQAPPNAWENQSGLRTRGNPTSLTSKPLETSGIPLLPKYYLSPCSTPFLTSTETSQTVLHQPYHLSPQPFFKALRWLPPEITKPSPAHVHLCLLPDHWLHSSFEMLHSVGFCAINPELLGL